MQNRNSEELFALIKSMSRCEKKSFHLFAKRNGKAGNLKVLKIYSVINAMEQYNEKELVRKAKGIQVKQLPGMKVFLYNLLLDSMRISRKEESIDLQLHQLMEHAKILYDKGFPVPALKTLKKIKTMSLHYHQVSFAFQAVVMEKKIELVHGSCDAERINSLNDEMNEYSQQLLLIGNISNISMFLYGWHKRHGHLTGKNDEQKIDGIYQPCSSVNENVLSFYPKLYWLQATTYCYIIKRENQLFYEAALKWRELFHLHPQMKQVEALQYQRAIASLSEAALLLNDKTTVRQCANELKIANDEFYLLLAELNLSLAIKEYDEKVLAQALHTITGSKNEERILVLSYKAALICSQHNLFERATDFTHTAINLKMVSRADIQYCLRLLHQKAHDQIGNTDIVEYLQASAERFAKINNLPLSLPEKIMV